MAVVTAGSSVRPHAAARTFARLQPLLWAGGTAASLLAVIGRWDVAVAAWIAPVLMLRFSRTSSWGVALAGIFATTVLQMVLYALEAVVPFNATTTAFLLTLSVVFAAPLMIDRLVATRLGGVPRLLLLPAVTVLIEFAAASLLPVGASIGTRAITQGENLALIQIVSVLGPYAIGFLIALGATAANAVWERPEKTTLLRYGGGFAALMLAVIGFGDLRLAHVAAGASAKNSADTVKVAGVVPDASARAAAWAGVSMAKYPATDATMVALSTPAMRAAAAKVQAELLDETRTAARNGAKIIQWSETAAPVLAGDKPAFLQKVADLARSEGVYINAAIGVPFQRNETFLFAPDGHELWNYRKNHPVPGMEPVAPFKGAAPVAATPYGRLSNVICYDADFPALSRAAADILLLPGWDWPEEGFLHTMRIARLRAVENGYSMIRVDYNGLSAAFDPYGRVLASQDTLSGKPQIIMADLPIRGVATVYGRIGDAFAWLCGLISLALVGLAFSRRAQPSAPLGT